MAEVLRSHLVDPILLPQMYHDMAPHKHITPVILQAQQNLHETWGGCKTRQRPRHDRIASLSILACSHDPRTLRECQARPMNDTSAEMRSAVHLPEPSTTPNDLGCGGIHTMKDTELRWSARVN